MRSKRLQVVLLGDEPLFMSGLRALLEGRQDISVKSELRFDEISGVSAWSSVADILIVAMMHYSEERDFEVLGSLTSSPEYSCPPLLVIVPLGSQITGSLLKAGARGVLKGAMTASEVASAAQFVATGYVLHVCESEDSGGPCGGTQLAGEVGSGQSFAQLTRREAEVYRHLLLGMTNAEIGHQLRIAESTVKSHIQNILSKLKVRDRVQAVIKAYDERGGRLPY